MRIGYETKNELQDICKQYDVYSDFDSKLSYRMVYLLACEKGYSEIVMYYFDHRKKLLDKDLIKRGFDVAKMSGSDEIVSLYYDYTGLIWVIWAHALRVGLFPWLLLTLFTNFDILALKHVNPFIGLLRR